MGPGASVAGLHWGSVPVVGPPPLAIAAAVGLVSVALLFALFVVDALAARGRPRSAPPPPPPLAVAVAPPEPEPVRSVVELPDLARAEVSALALARLRHFVAVADDPQAGDDDEHQRLARWAIFSAYRDCAALGLEPEAREVLHGRPGREQERALADGLSRSA
jgi:hypothetical protein